jgi:hypothetical protein
MRCISVTVLALGLLSATAHADEVRTSFAPRGLSVAANLGVIQPAVLGGANLEVDVRYRGFVFAYSHGWSLDLDSDLVTDEMRARGTELHIPVSTGFGVGPSLWIEGARSFVDLRLEGKMHRFEESVVEADRRTGVATYTTWTLGGGAYWTFVPFARRTDALRGLNASFSVRVWPKVATSLDDGKVRYAHPTSGAMEEHDAANIGIANTPLVINLSVGYVFQ